MYSNLDIQNILDSKENCPKVEGDSICSKVKKGYKFSTYNINSFQSVEYLLNRDFSINKILVDKLQDVCDNCNYTELPEAISSPGDTGGDCVEHAILTEDNNCIITEDNIPIIHE